MRPPLFFSLPVSFSLRIRILLFSLTGMLIFHGLATAYPVYAQSAGSTTAVFTGADERVYSIETNDTPTDGEATAIADGSLPAATYLSGKLATAFVRNTNSKSEVWFITS